MRVGTRNGGITVNGALNRAGLMDLVHWATLAPSGHNSQPWRFVLFDSAIEIRPDMSRRLPVVDPDDHALFVSLGCALENMLVAAEHAGLSARVSYFPSRSAGLRVSLSSAAPAGCAVRKGLFGVIPRRQSTRRAYDGRVIPAATLEALEAAADESGVSLCILRRADDFERVVARVREGCQAQFRDPDFLRELTAWVRFSRKEVEMRGDGLAADALGMPFVPRWLGERLLRLGAMSGWEAARVARQVRSSSALVVFVAESYTRTSWVRTGQAFQRFALTATAHGLQHAHVNMPCEVPAVRDRLRRDLDLSGWPMLLIRLGYARPMPRARRRLPEEVVIAEAGVTAATPAPIVLPAGVTGA